MTKEERIEKLEDAVSVLAGDLSYTLSFLSDIESIRESDKTRMQQISETLAALADTFRQ